MISLLMKALTRGDSPWGHYLWLLTVVYCHTKRPFFVWYPKKRADLKTIHDENDVLTDDELIVVRVILRKSRHACLYI